MNTFEIFREIRSFEHGLFTNLRMPRDFELIREIGWLQECGEPVTVTRLTQLGIAPPATLRRSLKRLLDRGIVTSTESPDDRRSATLSLAPGIATAYRLKVMDALHLREETEH